MRSCDTLLWRIIKEGTMAGRLDGGFNQQPPPPSYEQAYVNPPAAGYTQYPTHQVNAPFQTTVAPQWQNGISMGPQPGPCGGKGLSRKQFQALVWSGAVIGIMAMAATYYFWNRQRFMGF